MSNEQVSDYQVTPDWWMASDHRWYAPHLHPNYVPPAPPAPPAAPTAPVAPQAAVAPVEASGSIPSATDLAGGAATVAGAIGMDAPALPGSGMDMTFGQQVADTRPIPGATGPETFDLESSMPTSLAMPQVAQPSLAPTSPNVAIPPVAPTVLPGSMQPGPPPATPGLPPMASPAMAPASMPGPAVQGDTGTASASGTKNPVAAVLAALGGLLAIVAAFMQWGNGSVDGADGTEKALIEVGGFDSSAIITLLCGLALLGFAALLFLGIQQQMYWAIGAFVAGAVIIGVVVFSVLDINDLSNRFAEEWSNSAAAAAGDTVTTSTSMGVWITAIGGILGALAGALADRD